MCIPVSSTAEVITSVVCMHEPISSCMYLLLKQVTVTDVGMAKKKFYAKRL